MYCKKCGAKLHDEANFCMKCGEQVNKELHCKNCGVTLPADASFCYKCGVKQIVDVTHASFDLVIDNVDDWINKRAEMDLSSLNSIKSIKVASGIEKCPSFYNMKGLRIVELPDTLKEIGHQCFCLTNIGSIIIPDSVEIIGSHAFEACPSLTYVKMPHNIKRISKFAFLGCNKLQYIEYNNNR